MSVWTLKKGLEEKTFAEWGLNQLVKTTRSHAADSVTFTADGAAFDSANPFAFGSTLIVKKDGVGWFHGRVVRVPRAGAPASESLSYELAGPWWYLENLIFQQIWKVTDGVTDDLIDTLKSRIILRQDLTGAKTTTGAQVLEVLTYAIAHGAPFQLGSLDDGLLVPFAEVVDQSCAEMVKRELRWTPDAVTFFDYSTTPPTLHIKRRADCASVAFSIGQGEKDAEIQITPRYELQVPAVVLKFERENSINDESWTSVDVQTAGGTGEEFGALIMTIQLGGSHVTYQAQRVVTRTIETLNNAAGKTWWKKHLKWAADPSVVIDSVEDGQIALSDDTVTTDYPREIIGGGVPSWKSDTSVELQVTAKLSGTITSANQAAIHFEKQPVSARVTGTTLNGPSQPSKTYTQVTSVIEAEPIPLGMAAAFFATLSVLQYEGEFMLAEEECGGEAQIGKLLNLTGSLAEWTTMQAQIQSVTENVDSGTTRIAFGPTEHLNPQDLIELLRINRERVPSWRLDERVSGKATGRGGTVSGTVMSENENGSGAPAPVKKMVVTGADPPQVIMDGETGTIHAEASTGTNFFKAEGGDLTGAQAGKTFALQEIHYFDTTGAPKVVTGYFSPPEDDISGSPSEIHYLDVNGAPKVVTGIFSAPADDTSGDVGRQTVTVCEDGTEKTMEVLGTTPA